MSRITPQETCDVPGCERRKAAQGYCLMHYRRWAKNADLAKPNIRLTSHEEMFDYWMSRTPRPSKRCWNWKGPQQGRTGYGVIVVKKRRIAAHRFAYERAHGDIPDGAMVCHRCDNPLCVNPAHLYAGSPAENAHEAVFKGRFHASLTPAQVNVLRKATTGQKLTQREWGEAFGVTQGAISRALSRDTWRRVD